jgi:fatty acyl-CoA reductase
MATLPLTNLFKHCAPLIGSNHNLKPDLPPQRSHISSFYEGRSILVTGSTGFIGKVLIEKLVYSCPNIKRIYLLIRRAQGKSPHQRMLEMIDDKPFNVRLKRELLESKLVAIDSDLSKSGLGLAPADLDQLIDEVSLVFHVAASVKFEAPLDVNMRHNVVATKELFEIASKFKKLACFIHVSTAYSNCHMLEIDERVYGMQVPDDPMSMVVTKEMLENRPNTYTYTKAMAENVADQYADRMNVVIVRPSIVMSALKEPCEGWVDTINGPVGLSVLGALGILQKIKVNSEVVFDLIPVDIVSNALVAIGWAATERGDQFDDGLTDINANNISAAAADSEVAVANGKTEQTTRRSKTKVFNLTTGSENPCSFYRYFRAGREEAYKKPSNRCLRPLLTIPKQKGMNSVQYWIHKIISHLLFAYIVDFILGFTNQKKMVVRAVKRMHHANEMFDYFCSNQWTFKTDNAKKMRELMSPIDKMKYNCDVRTINWDSYAQIGWHGCRRFILKESDESIDQAKIRYKMVCFVYYATKLIFLIAAASLLSFSLNSKLAQWLVMLPIYAVVYLI